ncbi:nucleoside-diphosphate-sugar epimerase [Xylariales sp. PMI_506]|nr:nucleoside-diphosphate-sugar epimerase [Xylariales sp. PMI_506]
MRVFVTGSTGWMGKVVVQELISANHQVLGLCRGDEKAAALEAAGAEVLRGTITDLDVLKKGASACDGVIHLAFIHDFNDYAAACITDRAAIEAIGSALEGTGKPFLITSGTMMAPHNRVVTEDDGPDMTSAFASLRGVSELLALGYADKGVRVHAMRLPPTVHGVGDQGFTAILAASSRANGAAPYVGDGQNRWCAVHRLDAAVAYRLALEKEGAASGVYHVVADEGVALKDIAEAIGARLGLPAVSKAVDEVTNYGLVAMSLPVDNPASSAKTKALLSWTPTHPSLLEDIKNGAYDVAK